MANAGAMKLAQRFLGRTEITDIASGFRQVQRYTINKPAHQRLTSGPKKFRPDIQAVRPCERATLARKQMARRNQRPPWHVIEPAQHRIDLAVITAKPAALDSGEHVALEQHAFAPSRRKNGGVVAWQAHGLLMPRPQSAGAHLSSDRDQRAPGR